jgi:acetyl esterase
MAGAPQDSDAATAPEALLGSLHPYYRAILDANAAARRPSFHQLSPRDAREQLRAGLAAAPPQTDLPELETVPDEAVAGPSGPIPIRRYRPRGEVDGVCVFIHGGGWVIGDVNLSDALCRRLAAGAGCEVASVEYRLAPEHPYPAPLDDAFAVLNWAATLGRGPLVVAGESAGGNLAAACAIRARDAGGPGLAGQFLAYPVTDHDFTTQSYRQIGDRNWLLSTADMKWFWDQYCPPEVDRNDPLLSPLRLTDASGLPPAMVCAAELDPLRDEGLAYAKTLAQSGAPVRVRRDAAVLHGYLSAAGAVPAAAEAVREAAAWIKHRIREAGN